MLPSGVGGRVATRCYCSCQVLREKKKKPEARSKVYLCSLHKIPQMAKARVLGPSSTPRLTAEYGMNRAAPFDTIHKLMTVVSARAREEERNSAEMNVAPSSILYSNIQESRES